MQKVRITKWISTNAHLPSRLQNSHPYLPQLCQFSSPVFLPKYHKSKLSPTTTTTTYPNFWIPMVIYTYMSSLTLAVRTNHSVFVWTHLNQSRNRSVHDLLSTSRDDFPSVDWTATITTPCNFEVTYEVLTCPDEFSSMCTCILGHALTLL